VADDSTGGVGYYLGVCVHEGGVPPLRDGTIHDALMNLWTQSVKIYV